MKTNLLKLHRKAIAMIELIFAIVIMGIVLLSVPNLISISSSSVYTSLQQESIATAASQINLIMTKHWDENNTETGNGIILTTTAGSPSLNARSGKLSRSLLTSSGSTLSANSVFWDFNDTFDDIDDANGTTMTLRDFNTTKITLGDNIDTNITIATTVSYIQDATATSGDYNTSANIRYDIGANTNSVTNIKLISTRLTTNNPVEELAKDISLKAFSCNIGTYSITSRHMP